MEEEYKYKPFREPYNGETYEHYFRKYIKHSEMEFKRFAKTILEMIQKWKEQE